MYRKKIISVASLQHESLTDLNYSIATCFFKSWYLTACRALWTISHTPSLTRCIHKLSHWRPIKRALNELSRRHCQHGWLFYYKGCDSVSEAIRCYSRAQSQASNMQWVGFTMYNQALWRDCNAIYGISLVCVTNHLIRSQLPRSIVVQDGTE